MIAPAGFVVAAPSSGAGKTIVTLGLIRALVRRGLRVAPFKVGPDYIDGAFLAAAAGCDCLNLDTWAMRPAVVAGLARDLRRDADAIVGEGVMGLFDGGPGGAGGTADVAATLGLPVVLVVDAAGMGASIAAVAEGFARHRVGVTVRGVIANRVGSAEHRRILAAALRDPPLLGVIPRDAGLALPSRHLGLVQAGEQAGLDGIIERAATVVAEGVDLETLVRLPPSPRNGGCAPRCAPPARGGGDALLAPHSPPPLAGRGRGRGTAPAPIGLSPLGQRIAVARDDAFAFAYAAQLAAWHQAGADLSFFSPLADEPPDGAADAVFLPGGYPELHAPRLAANGRFLGGLQAAARRGATIYGECGGYMVLGRTLIDAAGVGHAMAGLLPHRTTFAERARHLGYRTLRLLADGPLGPAGTGYRGHEFHYARLDGPEGAPLFAAADAQGRERGATGSVVGRVAGSFMHVIDRTDPGL